MDTNIKTPSPVDEAIWDAIVARLTPSTGRLTPHEIICNRDTHAHTLYAICSTMMRTLEGTRTPGLVDALVKRSEGEISVAAFARLLETPESEARKNRALRVILPLILQTSKDDLFNSEPGAVKRETLPCDATSRKPPIKRTKEEWAKMFIQEFPLHWDAFGDKYITNKKLEGTKKEDIANPVLFDWLMGELSQAYPCSIASAEGRTKIILKGECTDNFRKIYIGKLSNAAGIAFSPVTPVGMPQTAHSNSAPLI